LVGDLPAFGFFIWKEGLLAKLLPHRMRSDSTLAAPQITDAGLKELARLKNLHTLSLYGTRVTDAGLKELAGLKNCKSCTLAIPR